MMGVAGVVSHSAWREFEQFKLADSLLDACGVYRGASGKSAPSAWSCAARDDRCNSTRECASGWLGCHSLVSQRDARADVRSNVE